jgi:pSer/pThr/pTyr-binding forkhead associated (FHA) protein
MLAPEMARAGLRIVGGPGDGRSFDVEDAVELGRGVGGPELSDPMISRRHARLSIDSAGRLTIEDLGSRNGTLVNGRVITGVETLAVGDVIDLGDTTLEVAAVEPSPVAPATSAPVPGGQATATRVARSRSIAAGLPVLSARDLIKRVRIRGAIAAIAVAVVLWLALYVQLENGDDPGLKKSAVVVQPRITTSGTSAPTTTSASPTTTSASPTTTSTSPTTTTTTTKQS